MAKLEGVITFNPEDAERAGENLKAIQLGDTLVLLINTSKAIGPSASGKMLGIASTGGFVLLQDGMKLNLYLGKKV